MPAVTGTGLNGNLVVNPSFEDAPAPLGVSFGVQGWSGSVIFTIDPNIAGNPLVQSNSGAQLAEIDFPDMFQAIVGTTAGQLVNISYFAANQNLHPRVRFPLVTFGGTALSGGTQTTSVHNLNYDFFSFTNVVVPVNDSVLDFFSPRSNFVLLDDVSVTPAAAAVPEVDPGSCAGPLCFALGALLLAVDRRRAQRMPEAAPLR